MLMLWAYCYVAGGKESSRYQEFPKDATYTQMITFSAEDGYSYLARTREEYYNGSSKLSFIKNKQNISGLCFLVGTKLRMSHWEVNRESAKLILNCGFRSIGKESVLCLDLFDN